MSIFRNDALSLWTRGGQATVHNVRPSPAGRDQRESSEVDRPTTWSEFEEPLGQSSVETAPDAELEPANRMKRTLFDPQEGGAGGSVHHRSRLGEPCEPSKPA